MRMRRAQNANNEARRVPRRLSPRLSESAKRRRTEASRGGRGSGPGSRAMEALTATTEAAEAAGSSAAAGPSAAGASAEAEDPLATQDQGGTADAAELENLDLSEGMDTGEADDGSLR